MKGFELVTESNIIIRFAYYLNEAPVTCGAFDAMLPFSQTFVHARVSGPEFWTDRAPKLDIIQENASVFTETGEVVIGPSGPMRIKTVNCMGIYYGEGKGLDICNIFAKVLLQDLEKLIELGEQIWKKGGQKLVFNRTL